MEQSGIALANAERRCGASHTRRVTGPGHILTTHNLSTRLEENTDQPTRGICKDSNQTQQLRAEVASLAPNAQKPAQPYLPLLYCGTAVASSTKKVAKAVASLAAVVARSRSLPQIDHVIAATSTTASTAKKAVAFSVGTPSAEEMLHAPETPAIQRQLFPASNGTWDSVKRSATATRSAVRNVVTAAATAASTTKRAVVFSVDCGTVVASSTIRVAKVVASLAEKTAAIVRSRPMPQIDHPKHNHGWLTMFGARGHARETPTLHIHDNGILSPPSTKSDANPPESRPWTAQGPFAVFRQRTKAASTSNEKTPHLRETHEGNCSKPSVDALNTHERALQTPSTPYTSEAPQVRPSLWMALGQWWHWEVDVAPIPEASAEAVPEVRRGYRRWA